MRDSVIDCGHQPSDLISSNALIGVLELGTAPWSATTPLATAVDGTPGARTVHMFNSGDREAGLWACTPGSFRSDHRGYVEFLHVVSGQATLEGDDGTSWTLTPGRLIVIPDGWTGTWCVAEAITTSFAIFRAGAPSR